MKRIIFILPAIILFMFSCKSTHKASAQTATQKNMFVKETKWVMVSFHGKKPAEAGFRERVPYVVIDKEAGTISGNSGCNSFSGKAVIEGDKMKAERIASTKAFCMGVPESEFFADLSELNTLKTEDNKLIFLKEGKVIMEFVAEPDKK